MSGRNSKEIRREAAQTLNPVAEEVRRELRGIRENAMQSIAAVRQEAQTAITAVQQEAETVREQAFQTSKDSERFRIQAKDKVWKMASRCGEIVKAARSEVDEHVEVTGLQIGLAQTQVAESLGAARSTRRWAIGVVVACVAINVVLVLWVVAK